MLISFTLQAPDANSLLIEMTFEETYLFREEGKVSNYIIKKILVGGMTRYQIGDQDFSDMSNLLNFYRTHYLDTATLVRPVSATRMVVKSLTGPYFVLFWLQSLDKIV